MSELETRLATPEQIRGWLRTAIHTAGTRDRSLWDAGATEQSRVARVARYLENQAPDSLNVDVEYNRQVPGQQHVGAHQPNPLNIKRYWSLSGEFKDGTPDLLLHQRGRNAQNLLVAEFKNARKDEKAWLTDLAKVDYWFTEFGYSLGCVVAFGPQPDTFQPTVTWFEWEGDVGGDGYLVHEDKPL